MKLWLLIIGSVLCGLFTLAQRPQVGTSTVGAVVTPFGTATWNQSAFTFTTIAFSNIAAGDFDLYTVPANTRGTYQAFIISNPTNLTTITFYSQVKTNGVYFRTSANATITTGSQATSTGLLVYEAGETFSLNTSVEGANVYVQWVEWPNTFPLYSPRILNPSTATNTIYSVPAGKVAFPLTLSGPTGNTTGAHYINDSGTTRTVKWFIIPSGGSAGQFTMVRESTVNDNVLSTQSYPSLGAGTSVAIGLDVDTATQLVFLTVMEL